MTNMSRPYRRWSKDLVLQAIVSLRAGGHPLNRSAVRRTDIGLVSAAVKLFSSWDSALTAAGVDPDGQRRSPRAMTSEELVSAIRSRRAAGHAMHRTAVEREQPRLHFAAVRRHGTWDAALLASLEVPALYRPFVPSEASGMVQAALRERRDIGLSLYDGDVYRDAPELLAAAASEYGDWPTALRLAGLVDDGPPRPYERRTTDQVVTTIRERHRRGQAINDRAVRGDDLRLHTAGKARFGTWEAALTAAGFDPDSIRRRRRPMGSEAVRLAILHRRDHGLPLSSSGVEIEDNRLLRAARRLHGEWDAALRATGLDPGEVRLHCPTLSREEIVRRIQVEHGRGTQLSSRAAQKELGGLVAAAIDRIGSWDLALAAAGLDPAKRRPPWTEASVLEALRAWVRSGRPFDKVYAKDNGLYQGAKKVFGTWERVREVVASLSAEVPGRRVA